ncbi:formate dehydrogenase accessory sulfurtransferase FdhD [Sphingomonas sp.]|uniref:formate dehydrogenase accessory sulfurtransferase FdhD n=1 Tax=Sphingomonas sp. TaxID=28214 RepID=UPI0025F629CB|nr:formate dehydrogenase accessory sulfurtransferase FdhD [Sphingomonas sp.]
MRNRDVNFIRIARDGERTPIMRAVAVEAPIAIEINGIGYAVMMATPDDLIDFAHGFVWSERLVEEAGEILTVEPVTTAIGHRLRIELIPERSERLFERFRHRVSDSSCGMCGIENLEQAIRPLPRVTEQETVADRALFRALGHLRERQPLNLATGAAHAAALCNREGLILVVREDVGRHNAFDKLIGAMLRGGLTWGNGFALLSSRCSYELVEKAALSDCPTLVTISAPTSLAVERARATGIRLIVLARSDSVLTPD